MKQVGSARSSQGIGSAGNGDQTHRRTGERWSILGILGHVGGTEWWYLDRLGLAIPREEVPEEPFEHLERIRAQLIKVLPGMAGSHQVVGVDGELWSPRKLLSRAVRHERDHSAHICGLRMS